MRTLLFITQYLIDLNPTDNDWSYMYIWSKDYLVQGIHCLVHLILTCILLPNDWSKDYLVQGIPCLVHLIFTWTGPSPAVQVDLVQGIHLPQINALNVGILFFFFFFFLFFFFRSSYDINNETLIRKKKHFSYFCSKHTSILWGKIIEISIPLQTPVLFNKSGRGFIKRREAGILPFY